MAKVAWSDPKIEVGGVDVSNSCSGMQIEYLPGGPVRVTLTLYGDIVTINGKAVNEIMNPNAVA